MSGTPTIGYYHRHSLNRSAAASMRDALPSEPPLIPISDDPRPIAMP